MMWHTKNLPPAGEQVLLRRKKTDYRGTPYTSYALGEWIPEEEKYMDDDGLLSDVDAWREIESALYDLLLEYYKSSQAGEIDNVWQTQHMSELEYTIDALLKKEE